ncbi:type I polyketide synthase [Candidatus Uabimicrobium amorphum]|uniref:Polyketide synthase n=1 Tax=Uabimicrobium amorphum TaxID=2596890 RepID=A0A5S9F7L6_UABAM|nr:type I polyketide synthase [Candidatus Uabimicrobium amorphum]BBM87372.1 polyketide synthase [Candidatus Uabimicrobium amorphum]
MNYYVVPYQIYFDDTMAYGTHHYLTNFKFQCIARESLLFSDTRGLQATTLQQQLDNVVLLTQEGYSRNLAPVAVGKAVAILMTYEDLGRSSVRLCFRVVRYDGVPVCCGFQTIVCSSKQGELVAFPQEMLQHFTKYPLEDTLAPDFKDKVLHGKTTTLFPEDVCAVGKEMANLPPQKFHAQFTHSPQKKQGTVFVFPGKDTCDFALLRHIYENFPREAKYIDYADTLAKNFFQHSFVDLIYADLPEDILKTCRDLDHIAIYLQSVICAQWLIADGKKPQLLVGHSFGEIAALTISGVFRVEEGLEIVCKRFAALAPLQNLPYTMAAVSSSLDTVKNFHLPVEIAGCNHRKQTVVNVANQQLEYVRQNFLPAKIQVTPLNTNYPFHSSKLQPAVATFYETIKDIDYKSPQIDTFSPIEQQFYTKGCDFASILAHHFVKPFYFDRCIATLCSQGYQNFIECGVGTSMANIIVKNNDALVVTNAFRLQSQKTTPRQKTTTKPRTMAKQKAMYNDVPIAVVSMGCVVPGANNVGEFWHNTRYGVSGIIDARKQDQLLERDFMSENGIAPDKTYSLLTGVVQNFKGAKQYAHLSKAERFLAEALQQCIAPLQDEMREICSSRIACFLGSTADGIQEYDEALLAKQLLQILSTLEEDSKAFTALKAFLSIHFESDFMRFTPHKCFAKIVDDICGKSCTTYLMDAACASSLYTTDRGIKELQAHDKDLVLAGGVFAPGPANSCLFSQFGGLSTTHIRSLDGNADGVIFGEGAALLALKRLPDALRDDNDIHGVIVGCGLSSDGKSSSVNVPKAKGQVVALENAYVKSGVDVQTIQHLEAHATATKVGDATEFQALAQFFEKSSQQTIALTSIKSLIGHTGWLAGTASIIKVCMALRNKIIPEQFYYDPNNQHEGMNIENSPFVIPTTSMPWKKNINKLPRRAAVSGFGFGGTNAHLVIEEYDPQHHKNLQKLPKRAYRGDLAVIAVECLFPDKDGMAQAQVSLQALSYFKKQHFPSPKKILLPDVVDHMDGSQLLAVKLVENLIASLPKNWENYKKSTGVILGMEGKAEHSVPVLQRLYADRFARLLKDASFEYATDDLVQKLLQQAKEQHVATGPYTLPGIMPNVTSGRVAHMYDLKGANLVIDCGERSLFEAICHAQRCLYFDDCDIVFAGGISYRDETSLLLPRHDQQEPQAGGIVLALTRKEWAKKQGFAIQAIVNCNAEGDEETLSVEGSLRGATGSKEILELLHGNTRKTMVKWKQDHCLQISPYDEITHWNSLALPGATPIDIYNPQLFLAPVEVSSASLTAKKILFLVDDIQWWEQQSIAVENYDVATMRRTGDYWCVSGEHVDAQLSQNLQSGAYDMIIATKHMASHNADELLQDFDLSFMDLLFLTAQQAYSAIQQQKTSLFTLTINAYNKEGNVHPYSGLFAGFIKSMARELPDAMCKSIHCDEVSLAAGLDFVATELLCAGIHHEIFYVGNKRKVHKLVTAEIAANSEELNEESVVLATGGARGVTAVLVEELLQKFRCKVIALGRTNLQKVPEKYRQMDTESFTKFEQTFYQEQLRETALNIKELKQLYRGYQAGNEIAHNLRSFAQLPGRIEYRRCDITVEEEMEKCIGEIYQKYGKVDLVIHGAGLQVSTTLPKKKLADFRKIIATKLKGIQNLYRSCCQHLPTHPHFHLLTSTFSYMGNDGQPDYGAANEALNRIAQYMNRQKGRWSSLAWLGWEKIGMTRDSEYAMIAHQRNLRPIRAAEGKAIFSNVLCSDNVVNISLTAQEQSYYQVDVATKENEAYLEWSLNEENAPYICHHLVNGVATLPGTFELDFAARTAQKLCPSWSFFKFENAQFHKFVKVFPGKEVVIKCKGKVRHKTQTSAVIHVQLLSDFIHKSGMVLQHNECMFEVDIHMRESAVPVPWFSAQTNTKTIEVGDPYTKEGVVKLSDFFCCLSQITIGECSREASFELDKTSLSCIEDFCLPSILVDALWRFSMIDDRETIYVPQMGGELYIKADINDRQLGKLHLHGSNPRIHNNHIFNKWVQAIDEKGDAVVLAKNLVAYRYDI